MAISQYEVKPLFAEPFFRANIGHVITPAQVAFIQNLKMTRNQVNLISDNLYIFEEPELKSIKDAVQETLDIYTREVMGIPQSLYVTQSWTLVNNPNIGMHGHSHSNSIISGSLYYCDLAKPVSSMLFDRHNSYQLLQLTPEFEKQNVFNTPMNIVTPEAGEVILFSSGLQHLVETNASKEPRYSIAFNTFIKGRLGDSRDVSELTL